MRLNDQITFRVSPQERRIVARAARLSGRTISEWARMVVSTEAAIQVESKGSTYPPLIKEAR